MIQACERWDMIASTKTWAYGIAHRAFVRHAWQKTGESAPAIAWEGWQVTEVLRALPARQRKVLALTIDGWTPAEMAGLLGLDPSAVRSSLMTAAKRLRSIKDA